MFNGKTDLLEYKMKLSGKVAIITGGGTGIGRSIAELFAREGASVVIAGRRLEKITEVQNAITNTGGSAVAIKADVTKQKDNQDLVRDTLRVFDKIDILVNNAGDFNVGAVADTEVEEWDRIFDVN